MIAVVLDTNVIVSATLIRGGNEARVLRAWQEDKYILVLSEPILREISRVFLYEKVRMRQWMSMDDVVRLVKHLAESAFVVPGKMEVRVCRDPGDDKFVAAALEAGAQYIVSGDADLTALGVYRGIRIVPPREFLRILESEEP